ncbi:glycosyltransferase [Nanoarchaeota archaeon]
MMKICYASQSFYPHIGGVSTYLLNLAKEMVDKGNDVTEVHLRVAGEEHEAHIKGIEIYRVPRDPIDKELMAEYSKFKEKVYKECHYNKKEFTTSPHEIEGFTEYNQINEFFGEQLNEILKERPADIVHIHDFQLLFAYKYVPRGTPCILTWHIPFIENMSKPLSEFLITHMKEYDKIIFSSEEYIKAAVSAGLPEEKTELIHPMANTEIFRPLDVNKEEVREKYKIPKDSKVILCVQRVDPKSGHEHLIRSMPDILKSIPDAKLVFVGGESMSNKISTGRQKLKQDVLDLIRQLRIEESVIWTGTIDYYDLPEVYNAVDVVTLCSKNEGFGLVVSEGMACGKPVVGTKVGGIPIQVKDNTNGFLVGVDDHRATAEAITKILQDKELNERLSKGALDTVEKNFKIERGIEKHLMLYNNVMKSKDEFLEIEYLDASEIQGIITDLDRTITDEPAKPYFDPKDYDRALLKELEDTEISLFLSTGRTIHYVKKLCKHFKVWRCVIAENGAVIYIPSTEKTITLNTSYMTKVKKIVREMNLPGTTIGKVIASIDAKNESLVKDKLGKLADEVDYSRNVNEIMIIPKGVDKGVGVRLAMRYLNINLDDTIVIGDGENDIPMFLNPGFKIALANAYPELKKFANSVTKKPSIEGIREVMSKLKR